VEQLGYELLGVEFVPGRNRSLVRLYIDSESGVTIEDCERVSHEVSGALDVEDPVRGTYTLEVSSPGFDRPLFKPAHFERHAGCRVRVRLRERWERRRKLTGVLRGFRDGKVLVDEDGVEYAVPHDAVASARVVPGGAGG